MATAALPRTTPQARPEAPRRAPSGPAPPTWLDAIPAPRPRTIAAIRALGASDAEVYEALGWLVGERVHGRTPEPDTVVDRVRRLLRES